MSSEDMTLYAKWDPYPVISFESDGGSEVPSISEHRGENINTPDTPEKAGHSFEGWYLGDAYNEAYVFDTMPKEDLVLHAKWDELTYEIMLETNGDDSLDNVSFDYGNTVDVLPTPTKTDYTFAGWLLNGNLIETPFEYTYKKDITLQASWDTVTEGGLEFNIVNEQVNIVSYSGDKTELILPDKLAGKPVVEISEEAFMNNSALTHIVVGKYVTTVKDNAFRNMTALTTIEFPNATQTFGNDVLYETDNLEKMILSSESENELKYYFGNNIDCIPGSLEIVKHATGGESIDHTLINASMKDASLALADDLTRVDAYLFMDNSHIEEIILPDGLEAIGVSAFHGSAITSIHIPSSVETIEYNAFKGVSNLTIFTEHEDKPADWHEDWNPSNRSVVWSYQETIDNGEILYALSSDQTISILGLSDNVSNVDLIIPSTIDGNEVVQIVNDAFEGNEHLLSVKLPNTLAVIQSETFRGAKNLHTITFKESAQITSIGYRAFYNTSSLSDIDIPVSVTRIEDFVFYGTKNLTSVDFAANSQVTFIGVSAFLRAESLRNITVPASVTTIKAAAFGSTFSLTSVIFEEGSQLTRLNAQVFFDATSLTSIEIPASITIIKAGAFSGASSLTSVTLA
jgi:uncharacterized repeat protein (TIGR02543 family)